MATVNMEIKTLYTQRLVLKKLTLSNLDDYVEWKSQAEYHKFLPSKPKTREEYLLDLQQIIAGYDNEIEPVLLWGIFFDNKLIGTISIEDWNTTHKWCELGWGVNPKYQKQGFAYEAVKAVMMYIFDDLKMNRVSVVIWDGNEDSKRLAKKLGFVEEGISRQARYKGDKFIDLYHYGILKSEWDAV